MTLHQDGNFIKVGHAAHTQPGHGPVGSDLSRKIGQRLCSQALSQTEGFPVSAVLVFTSVRYHLEGLLEGIDSALSGHETADTFNGPKGSLQDGPGYETVPVIGTTTAGEIAGHPLSGSAVVTVLASPYLYLRAAVGRDVSQGWRNSVHQAASSRELFSYFTADPEMLAELHREGRSLFGLLFSPGNTKSADSRSYEIMEELKQLSRGRFPIFGGSSADDWKMEENYVLLGKKAFSDSMLLAVFETELRCGMGMAHGFLPTDKKTTVTRADGHEVLEFELRPAASRYAELLGMDEAELKDRHLTLTTGKLAGIPVRFNDYAINVASFITPRGGIRFTQPLLEGMQITIMEAAESDLLASGILAVQDALLRGEINRPAVALVFSCAIRERILGDKRGDEISSICELLPDAPVTGFYSFGEQGVTRYGMNIHNNGAITTLVIGDELSGPAVTAKENRKLISNLNQHIKDLQEAREEIERLNTFLRAIRNVNQAIVKQKGIEPLLEEICRQFSREQIFDGSFIVMLDNEHQVTKLVWKGQEERMTPYLEEISRGGMLPCLSRMAVEPVIRAYGLERDQVHEECKGCSLFAKGRCRRLIAAPISYKDRFYGALFLVKPAIRVLDQQWHGLLEEISGDIGYGIHFIHLLSENRRVQEQLERVTLAMEHTADLIMITDVQGTILYVNPAFERVTGYSRQEALGQKPTILKSGHHPDQFYQELWNTILSGRVWKGEFINRKKDGSIFIQESTISPIRDGMGSEVVGFVAVLRDVTEKRDLEESLKRAQKLEAIGTLAAGIAHDFNNILTSIIGHAELSQLHMQDNPKALSNIGQILKAGMRARDLVKQILTYARQTEEERKEVRLAPIVQETVRFIKASLPKKIEISCTLDTDGDRVWADSSQLYQVVLNLCTNAAQAMKDKGGRLNIKLKRTTLTRHDSLMHADAAPGDYVVLEVRDTGCGIPEELKERIFDPYFSTKQAEEGTGLGLAVVQGIVQAHGGFITVESEQGKGSTFRVFLPAQDSKEEKESQNRGEQPVKGTGRILLVEDEPALLDMMSRILNHLGYSVVPAADGLEALAIFERDPGGFDLVISDLEMPKMGGDELVTKIAAKRQDIPIIMVTGYNELKKTRPLSSGIVDKILLKPFTISDLSEALDGLLGASGGKQKDS